jgi:hypothetical protein
MKKNSVNSVYKAFFFIIISAFSTLAQTPKVLKGVTYEAEAGVFLSTTPTNPFWIRTNQFGEVPLNSQVLTLRGQARKEYDSTKKMSYGYGARAVLNTGMKNQLLVTELYAKARYKALEVYAGRRREIVGLVDTTLTSGSYIWSGNALPIPKVEIAIQEYIPVLFKSKLLSVKGMFAHGWFGSGDSTRNFFLNQSQFYVRIGKPTWRFRVYGGLNHQAQWGGKPTVPFYDPVTQTMVTSYANSPEAFLNVALGIPIDYDGQKFLTGGQVYGEGNRAGNHLGSLDVALEYSGKSSRWLLYRQSIYDDGSLFYLNNIDDGLTGISWASRSQNPGLKRLVIELLRTSNQGGPYSARAAVQYLRGQDNYFNNGVYEEGWVYRQQTIGTGFLMPLRYTTGLAGEDALAGLHPDKIFNNRVDALIISAQTRIKSFEFITRVSGSRNYGSYEIKYPMRIDQLSVLQKVTFPFRKNSLSAAISYDGQGVLEKNIGLMLLAKRSF